MQPTDKAISDMAKASRVSNRQK